MLPQSAEGVICVDELLSKIVEMPRTKMQQVKNLLRKTFVYSLVVMLWRAILQVMPEAKKIRVPVVLSDSK